MKKYGLIIGFTFLMGVLAGCSGTGSTTQDQAKTDAAHEVEAQDGAVMVCRPRMRPAAGYAVTLPDLNGNSGRLVIRPACGWTAWFIRIRALCGPVIAVGDSSGNVKGYVGNADCPTEYYENGKINVAKAVGRTGMLNVMRDYGSGDPYIGQVELVSGEIAEHIANYYATSETFYSLCLGCAD